MNEALKIAANAFASDITRPARSWYDDLNDAFVAGAEWQRGQGEVDTDKALAAVLKPHGFENCPFYALNDCPLCGAKRPEGDSPPTPEATCAPAPETGPFEAVKLPLPDRAWVVIHSLAGGRHEVCEVDHYAIGGPEAAAQRIAAALNLLHRTECEPAVLLEAFSMSSNGTISWSDGRSLDLAPMLRNLGWFRRPSESYRNVEETFANAVCGYGCERRFVPNLLETLRRQGLCIATVEELATAGEAARENALLRGKLAEATAERDELTSEAVTAEVEWTIERAVGQRQLDMLRTALAKCAERFREDERINQAKLKDTTGIAPIAAVVTKIDVNRRMAEMCEGALFGEVPEEGILPTGFAPEDGLPMWRLDTPSERGRLTGSEPPLMLRVAASDSAELRKAISDALIMTGHYALDETTLRTCIDIVRGFQIAPEATAEAVRLHLMVEMTRCLPGSSPCPDGPPSGSGLPGSTGTDGATRAREDVYDPRVDTFVDLAEALAGGPFEAGHIYGASNGRRAIPTEAAVFDCGGEPFAFVRPENVVGGTVADALRECERIADALNAVDGMTCEHCHDLGHAHATDCPLAPPRRKPWIKPGVRRMVEPGSAEARHPVEEMRDIAEAVAKRTGLGVDHAAFDTAQAYLDEPVRPPDTASDRLEQRLTERAGALGMAGLRGLNVSSWATDSTNPNDRYEITVNLGDLAEAIIAEVRTRQAARGSWG